MEPRPSRRDDRPRSSGVLAPLRGFLEQAPELRPLSLRFADRELELGFRASYFRDSLPYIRLAHVLGIVTWSVFGLLAQVVLTNRGGAGTDLFLRYGLGVPLVAVSLALSYAPWYPRVWRPLSSVVLILNAVIWSTHRALVADARPDWGYAGLMVILAFTYVLIRLPFSTSAITGAVMIAYHNVITIAVVHDGPVDLWFADYFLIVFAVIGMAAAYGLERSTRLLFLRERQLDRERRRSDDLLRNILPGAIVDRLKTRDAAVAEEHIADGHPQVTVLFADLVDFTHLAGRATPHDIVVALDDVFTRFDALAGRLGMEKIKTVGDAYMAVAGAPEPRPDHARAAAEGALGILASLDGARWPTGEPMDVRIGIASGPAVAGVIGRRKFAYDLWGDTVNLASRLESNGRPGRVLVAEPTYELLKDGYVFSDLHTVELKGKGATPARFLLSRNGSRAPV